MAHLDLRLAGAVGLGKLAGATSRGLRLGGGTTMPGDVARAIDPRVLSKLAASAALGTVLVTGTNGKTSTTAMLRAAISDAGWRVASNSSGSNLVYGLTAAAITRANLAGRLGIDWLILEVDELSAPQAVAELKPRGLVVLNVFRDQLDRSFEVDQVSERLATAVAGLPPTSFWVGNADDPRVASIGVARNGRAARPGLLFGIDDLRVAHAALPVVADARVCPLCRSELDYSRVYYAHCGVYHCRGCGFSRPEPQVRATNITTGGLDSVEVELVEKGVGVLVKLPVGGIYHAANVAAAFTAATAMGVSGERAGQALSSFQPAFGRSQLASWRGSQVRLLLTKNPAGLDANLRAVMELDTSPVVAIALNDGVADGRDISWIWDIDLERLAVSRPLDIVASGTRARDLALRLAYSGLGQARIRVCPQPEAALTALAEAAVPGTPAPALLTYTAMMEWHRLLVRSGAVDPFWAGA